MTSVVMRALGLTRPRPENDYRPNATLTDAVPVLPMAGPQPGIPMEVAAAPHSGSPVLDILQARGWRQSDDH